jgi:hypothetical protein
MCRKPILLVVTVFVVFSIAPSYAPIIPPPPDCPWIIDYCPAEFDEVTIGDCGMIVTETGCLILNERSHIDGVGAHLVVDGGSVTVNARFDMGQGEDAYLTVKDGGSFTQQCPGDYCDEGLKLPDESGGEHLIIIRNIGTVHCYSIEVIPERDAEVQVGWGVTLILDHALESPPERYNPEEWLEFGWLVPIDGVTIGDIRILWEGERAIVTTPPPCDPLKASKPTPADGEKGIASVETDVILCWMPACGIGTLGRHYLFFSSDKGCVENGDSYHPLWIPPDCYVPPPLLAATTCKNMGNRPLWTKYYWRVDEKLQTGEMIKGDVWRFTTGCDPVPAGDVNLDCLVNLADWALIMTTWGEEQFFPWD